MLLLFPDGSRYYYYGLLWVSIGGIINLSIGNEGRILLKHLDVGMFTFYINTIIYTSNNIETTPVTIRQ